jgi:hypothetical protein
MFQGQRGFERGYCAMGFKLDRARSKLDSGGDSYSSSGATPNVCIGDDQKQLLPIARSADPRPHRRDKLAGVDAKDEV